MPPRERERPPTKRPNPNSNSPTVSVPTRPERLRYVRADAILADVHARTIRAYEAIEDGDADLASDLLHDLTRELAEWRAAFEREAP